MKITTTTWWIIGAISITGLGLGGYFYWKKSESTESDKYGNLKIKTGKQEGEISGGVVTVKDGVGVAVTEPNWNNPYDLNYTKDVKHWVAPRKIYVPTNKTANALARKLKKAKGAWFTDDKEGDVKAVFKAVNDKVAVSRVSQAFWQLYKKDMWDYLAGFLSKNELKILVQQPVAGKPNYRIGK